MEKTAEFAVGERVRHYESNWEGPVLWVRGDLVTVRPDHPRPKQILRDGRFIPTPDDWEGWAPLTVAAAELERV